MITNTDFSNIWHKRRVLKAKSEKKRKRGSELIAKAIKASLESEELPNLLRSLKIYESDKLTAMGNALEDESHAIDLESDIIVIRAVIKHLGVNAKIDWVNEKITT